MNFEEWWEVDALDYNLVREGMETVAHVSNMSERCRLLSKFWAKAAFEYQEKRIKELEEKACKYDPLCK